MGDNEFMKKSWLSSQGFTMVELMIVIAIIAVLTTIGIGGYSSSIKRSRDTVRKSDIEAISQALTLYRMDWGRYPTKEEYIDQGGAAMTNNGKSFASYIPWKSLFDPSSRTLDMAGEPYVYFCGTGSGVAGTGAPRCRQFMVCALLESKGGGNYTLNPGCTATTTTGLKSCGGRTDAAWTVVDIKNVATPALNKSPELQWYCAQSS